jgi:hypothetical protein
MDANGTQTSVVPGLSGFEPKDSIEGSLIVPQKDVPNASQKPLQPAPAAAAAASSTAAGAAGANGTQTSVLSEDAGGPDTEYGADLMSLRR